MGALAGDLPALVTEGAVTSNNDFQVPVSAEGTGRVDADRRRRTMLQSACLDMYTHSAGPGRGFAISASEGTEEGLGGPMGVMSHL